MLVAEGIVNCPYVATFYEEAQQCVTTSEPLGSRATSHRFLTGGVLTRTLIDDLRKQKNEKKASITWSANAARVHRPV